MGSKIPFIIAGVLIVAAVAVLMVTSTNSSASYFMTVEEVSALINSARDAESGQRSITVSGAVLGETILYNSEIPEVSFVIVHVPGDPKEVERLGGLAQVLHDAVEANSGPRLSVVYKGIKPDLLTNEAQAIVRGKLGEDGRFHADDLLLKCPSRYEEDVPAQSE